ncbi:hypothetical protein KVT40_006242 [Elsinoe batatas]|uniref:Glycerate kinase n=1 Tax=Elsinoe batatas TaxID=2601811 RepID=A0A8K0KXB4_9PEZI|nr:hypothetical protein KVT40_006242 [Elsinoe batatas]
MAFTQAAADGKDRKSPKSGSWAPNVHQTAAGGWYRGGVWVVETKQCGCNASCWHCANGPERFLLHSPVLRIVGSGGMGAGLILLGAHIRPRYEAIMEWFGINDLFEDCQLVFTAEGGIDFQTPNGKIPSDVANRAKAFGIPVIALAGTVGQGADVNYQAGIDAFTSILQAPTTLDKAIAEAERLVTDAAESTMRMVMVGLSLGMGYESIAIPKTPSSALSFRDFPISPVAQIS